MDDTTALDLLEARQTAETAEARKWLLAARLIRSGRVTEAEVCSAYRVSRSTFYRQVKRWHAHLDAGPGVGS